MLQHKLLAFAIHYGYMGIFGVLVLGIIGLPIPDEVLMTFAGYLIWKGQLHYLPTVLTSILGSFLGMSTYIFRFVKLILRILYPKAKEAQRWVPSIP